MFPNTQKKIGSESFLRFGRKRFETKRHPAPVRAATRETPSKRKPSTKKQTHQARLAVVLVIRIVVLPIFIARLVLVLPLVLRTIAAPPIVGGGTARSARATTAMIADSAGLAREATQAAQTESPAGDAAPSPQKRLEVGAGQLPERLRSIIRPKRRAIVCSAASDHTKELLFPDLN